MLSGIARRALLAGVAATAALWLTAAQAQDINDRVIRFGFGNPPDTPSGQGAQKLSELVEQKSGGKIKMRLFGSGQLGPDPQMQTALIGGSQEMMVGSTATLVGMVKEFGILDLPFVFETPEEAYAVVDGPVGDQLRAKLADHGLVGIAFWDNGFRNLTNSRRPVATMEDLQGIKLRVMQNPVYMAFFADLGVNPVPMPFSDVFGALETKAIDGQENPAPTIDSYKLYEVQPYMSLTRHAYAAHLVMASKKWWDTLTPDEQALITEAVLEVRPYQREINNATDDKAVESLKSKGMQVSVVPPEELLKMREKVKPVVDKFAAEFAPELSKQMFEQVEALRTQ